MDEPKESGEAGQTYTCTVCGMPVTVVKETGEVVRPYCEHADAPVVGHMRAVVYGESKVAS
jgi:uncharacterized Zn finger protein (UPF0148 family)